MQTKHITARLLLDKLALTDAPFIFELVNKPEWILFIGDRNVRTMDDACAYVKRIMDNKAVQYWVVKLKESLVPVGIITFIKRDYLDHSDLGFAFLPPYAGKGYAFEAASLVLNEVIKKQEVVLATTVKENDASIRLLKKLGFGFEKQIIHDQTPLMVYTINENKWQIDQVVKDFFLIFNNKNKKVPDWQALQRICIKETLIIKKREDKEEIYDLVSFTEPRKKLLENGTLLDFEEHEINEETTVSGNIAQRFSVYGKSGCLNNMYFNEKGKKCFQFIKTTDGWKICSVIWEDDKTEK